MTTEIHVSSMVSQLVNADIPVSEIAREVGVANSTITRIKAKSVDPRYSHFVKIRTLWVTRLCIKSNPVVENYSV